MPDNGDDRSRTPEGVFGKALKSFPGSIWHAFIREIQAGAAPYWP